MNAFLCVVLEHIKKNFWWHLGSALYTMSSDSGVAELRVAVSATQGSGSSGSGFKNLVAALTSGKNMSI